MRERTNWQQPDVAVSVNGSVPPDMAEYAQTRIAGLAERAHEPIEFGRARLTQSGDPANERPAEVQANLDLNGRVVRAHVAAATMTEAIELAQERLAHQLDHLARRHPSTRRDASAKNEPEHEWWHGHEPTQRPSYYPRPAEERRIVREKSFALEPETREDAAADMDLLDYDFYLFSDADTGMESVIYRAGNTGYRLASAAPPPKHPSDRVTVSPQPGQRLSVAEARDRLELAGWPFVFFVDNGDGQASVLYHRYDGHYGLLKPAS
jgi:ribosome-associated translation inhibitor RaiA